MAESIASLRRVSTTGSITWNSKNRVLIRQILSASTS